MFMKGNTKTIFDGWKVIYRTASDERLHLRRGARKMYWYAIRSAVKVWRANAAKRIHQFRAMRRVSFRSLLLRLLCFSDRQP